MPQKSVIPSMPTELRESENLSPRTYRPPVDVIEGPDGVTLYADLPGVLEKDIEIEIADGTLTIQGKVELRQDVGTRFLRREYDTGNFSCSFKIGDATDTDNVRAELQKGVLAVTLPKAEAARPRRIAVQTK